MQSMYSFLALPGWLSGNAIVIAAVAAVALIAVIVGAVRGFTRIGWGALFWGLACGLFWVLDSRLHDSNPLLKLGAVSRLEEGVRDFIASMSWALVAILASLVVYGLFSLIFRSRRKAALRGVRAGDDEDIEDEDIDEDEEEEGGSGIGIVNRIFGALVALVNAVLVCAGIVCLLLVVFDLTPLRDGALQSLYSSALVEKFWTSIHTYTLDFLLIAVIAAIGYSGYRSGIIGGFRSVLLAAGYIAAIIVAFWLPFSAVAAEKEWLSFVGQLSDAIGGFIARALPENVAAVLGKVSCGIILCVGLCIAVALIGLLLKLIERAVRRTAALRVVDGILSTVVLLVLGVLVCALIVAILYIFDYFGVFPTADLFEDASPLAKGLFDVFDKYLVPLFERIKGIFG